MSGVADAAANAYEHGGNIGRQYTPQGTVHNITSSGTTGGNDFKSAIKANNGDIVLQADINLGAVSGTDDDFEYNIYGNGYTITFTGALTDNGTDGTNKNDNTYWGGVIGTLSGAVYDLNVIMSSGQITILNSSSGAIALGGMIGKLDGGRIENCTMTLSDPGTRIGAVKNSSNQGEYAVAAAMVAMVEYGSTIRNCTVSNNAWIESGLGVWQNGRLNIVDFTNSSGGWGSADGRNQGRSGNLAGQIGHYDSSGTVTIDNIIITNTVTGSSGAQVQGIYVGNIGIVLKGTTLNVTNFYNDFSGTYTCAGNGGSATISHDNSKDGTASIVNYYIGNGAVASLTNSSGVEALNTITNRINVPDSQSVHFDPKAENVSTSLAVVFTGRNKPASGKEYEYTISGSSGVVSGATFTTDDSGTTRTVVARNLPTAIGTWGGNNGTFTATLNETEVDLFNDYLPDPTVYEHGYVAKGSETSDGTPISTSAEWDKIFSPTGTGDTSGNYYLTKDIVISGFTGKTFSGTLDGNGNTIYIIDTFQNSYDGGASGFGRAVGGLAGVLTGTIKNVRVAFVNLGSTNTINVNMSSTGVNPRIGLVAGVVNGGTIKNVQAYVENGVTVNGIKAADNSVAMGGIAGYATANAQFTDVTLDLNGTLAPTGAYQYLGGIVGLIDNENGATFTDVAIRGTGTFAGTAGNTEGEPTYYGAIAVIKADSTKITSTYATVNGLIYDFDVKLAGTGGGGQSNNSYSCYYLFTNNYKAGASEAWVSENGAISGYNGAVSYRNVFVASDYIKELEDYAQQRTFGNAAIGGAVINTVQNKVEGLENPVAAYFNPVDGADDMIFRASGSWDSDRMVITEWLFSPCPTVPCANPCWKPPASTRVQNSSTLPKPWRLRTTWFSCPCTKTWTGLRRPPH